MNPNVLTKIQYGMYIISSKTENKISGQVANTVMQVTSEPIQFAVCISKNNFTYDLIINSGKFSIAAISEEAPFEFIGKFGFKSGRDINKFENVKHFISKNTLPVITEYTTAVYELEVVNKVDASTHVVFIGKVLEMQFIDETKQTMTYDYYHKIKGGLTSKNAPTFIKK